MIKYIKKLFKWYLNNSVENWACLPTGTLPPNIYNR